MSATGFSFYPESVVWEITFACNMRCIHCGTAAGKRRPDELTTDEALKLIDDLKSLGCRHITISGGEPLLRDDWRELAARIKSHDMRADLITNGFAVTPEIAQDFKRLGLTRVGVSLDGMEDIHNYIRKRPDSFKKVMQALGYLREAAVDFCVVTQVSNLNLDELDAMHKMLVSVGCPGWRIQMCTTTGRMHEHAEMVLSLDNYEKLIDKLIALKKSHDIYIDVGENIGYYGCKGSEVIDGQPYFGCYAGLRIAGIESNGNVKGCLSMPEEFVEGNVRDSSLAEIWNNPSGFAYNRKFTKETAGGACHDCRYLQLCRGGCTTTSVSQSGCRADNPFCMYQIEQKKGISSQEAAELTALVERVQAINESRP